MQQHWLYPETPYWPRETVYIVGGGPSLSDIDLDLIKDKNVIGVNEAYSLGDFVDYTFIGNNKYYKAHKDRFGDYRGQIVCAGGLSTNDPRVLTVYSCNDTMTMRRGRIGIANNSGIGAMNLAAQLGAKTIVLLGFDMTTAKGNNWHKQNVTVDYYKRQIKEEYYVMIRERMSTIVADALYALDIDVVNCTPGSAIDCFPHMTLEAYLESTEEGAQFIGDFKEEEEIKPTNKSTPKKRKKRTSKKKDKK